MFKSRAETDIRLGEINNARDWPDFQYDLCKCRRKPYIEKSARRFDSRPPVTKEHAMRIFDAIALLFSRAAGRRTRSAHSAFAHAARGACPSRRVREGRAHGAPPRHPTPASRTREPFEIRRPERFGVGDFEPGSSNAPEAGGIKL
ncbi:hypothetical protein A33K_17314 [Burkholderia humptydooensis MSMB43]|nr:hypothetical protein A33K_17314 [Burkholderia humptydooensis MSMB43]